MTANSTRLTLALVLASLTLTAAPAGAIVYGTPDGSGHPEVGALLRDQPLPDGAWMECSGTLIAPTIFLTAAHCYLGASHVQVTFASPYIAGQSQTYGGTFVADPLYDQKQSDPHDQAVVVLDHRVGNIAPAALPAAGSLSGLNGSAQFTSVGYGAYVVDQGGGPKTLTYPDVRWVATGTLNSLTSTWLKISENPSTGNGGTCYGDSGGPNFLGAGTGETNIVAGITITGDTWCRSTNVDYRMDTPSARTFLGRFVTLP
jgi:secreted trypsin-like serine protease